MSARRFCTETATIKRRNATTNVVETIASGVKVTPLWPISQDSIQRAELNTPRTALECYHVPDDCETLPTVLDGDRLVHNGTEYAVVFAGTWNWSQIPGLHFILDKVWGT